MVIDALGEGGTERSLVELLPGLREAGFQPHVVCLGTRGAEGYEDEVRASGVAVDVLGAANLPVQVVRLRRVLSRVAPSLVHTMLFRSNLVARAASIGSGRPVLTSLVNTSYSAERFADPGFTPLKLGSVRAIDRVTSGRTTHFHAVSHAVAADAIEHLRVQPSRITVIPRGRSRSRLGHPTAERRTAARDSLDVPATAFHVVTLGRHEHQKGLDVALVAIDSLVRGGTDIRLTLAGREGRETSLLHRLAAPIGDKVRFLGHTPDIGTVLSSADLMLLPSRYEGLPGAVIEAMAMGLPIIASDIAPVREVLEVGRNALVFAPGDAVDLARSITQLIDEPDRLRVMGEQSLDIFASRFTIEAAADAMANLYRRLLGGTRG